METLSDNKPTKFKDLITTFEELRKKYLNQQNNDANLLQLHNVELSHLYITMSKNQKLLLKNCKLRNVFIRYKGHSDHPTLTSYDTTLIRCALQNIHLNAGSGTVVDNLAIRN